jgi:spermidine/putrescine transport system substrate-binding protein
MKYVILIIIVLFFPFVSSCTKKGELNIEEKSDKILRIFNWEEYIGSETLDKFTEQTGISVQMDIYEDEEEMFALIRSDLSAYDLVVASDDLVREMTITKILSKIDLDKIPNAKYLDDKFVNLSFDPKQEYSIPYLWGTTGLVINTLYIDENENSWNVLFSDNYAEKIAMLNNPYEVLSVPLKLMGESINTTDKPILLNAEKKLMEQRKNIHGYYDAITIVDMLISEEIWAAQIYSGEGIAASDENENLQYIIPEEGAPIWLDTFVIPRDAENIDSAHLFLNFIMEPEINASIASELWYATANLEALKYMDREVIEMESVFPDKNTLLKCEYYGDIGNATKIVSEIWSHLKNQ